MKKLSLLQETLIVLVFCTFSLSSIGQDADTLSDEEKRLVKELGINLNVPSSQKQQTKLTYEQLAKELSESIKPLKENDAFKAEPIYRTNENEKYIEEDMSFNKDGLESGSVERQYQQILNERKEKSERNIIIVAIFLICTLVVFLVMKEKKNSVTSLQSKIKTVNEQVLKQNLDLTNSAVTEVDNETLKKKLGL